MFACYSSFIFIILMKFKVDIWCYYIMRVLCFELILSLNLYLFDIIPGLEQVKK